MSLYNWCSLSLDARVLVITDSDRIVLAGKIAKEISNGCRIINFDDNNDFLFDMQALRPSDLVIVLFSLDTFVLKRANKIFSPFEKPAGVAAKYIFIRLGISTESLLQGLSTPKELVYDTIEKLHKYKNSSKLHIANSAGTDIFMQINAFSTGSHEIKEDGGMAFLPPSETSAEVMPNTANGKIVVDVTVGQLYYYAEFLGYFGLVDEPVTLIITDGIVSDIIGGKLAVELKEKLFALPNDCRVLVELGHGLSKMIPTGLIGVDESIIDTCHFGFGDGGKCGVHLDVVVSEPIITEVLA